MHKIFKHVSGLCLLLFCCYMIFGRWSENEATNIKYKQTSRKHKEINQKYGISSLDDTLRPHTVGQSHLQRSNYDDKKNNQHQRQSCEFWSSSKKLLTSSPQPKPRFKTNPRKFILPWLYNGPNNQLMGLRQAVFVAIYLNRTLVIPVFQKHFNDKTGGMQYIDSNHRFDVPSLQSLIPIITIDEFKRHCGNRIDVVFFGASTNKQQWTLESLIEAERLYKLDILDEKYRAPNSKVLGKGIVKSKSFPTKERGFLFKAEKKAVVEQYNSSRPCAFYTFPFRELRFIVPQVAAKYQTIESNYLNGEEIKETP
uniref:GDP-fucose protein O-fucosyltransferase 2 n=1 Tax=Ciona savignyi TaxID=51511 RepID=H2YAJ9_CIOSA